MVIDVLGWFRFPLMNPVPCLQKPVDAVTGEPVRAENKARGYEVGENQFLLVKEEELETAQQVARALPFSAAPATSPATREGLRPIKRVEADRPRAVKH